MNNEGETVAVVTGASSGIGEAAARRLAARGCRVVLFARRAERLEALARELDPTGSRVLAVAGDVASDADRRRLVAAAEAAFGRIDVLVNNAGYGQRGPLERIPVERIRANFEVNVFSLVALTQRVVPGMRDRGRGRIVNLSSVAGRIARPMSSVYDATKHALEALSDGLRGELAPFGIRVVVVRPGYVATEFVDAANAASDADLADLGPYARYLPGFRAGYARLRRIAAPAEVLGRVVERAALDPNPRIHYASPGHARVFLAVRWLLSARLFDRIVRLREG